MSGLLTFKSSRRGIDVKRYQIVSDFDSIMQLIDEAWNCCFKESLLLFR